ncbi:DUF4271 domain-containing protein [Flavobacteriales bacterium]|nr:DUF4271 domain-containing protein [Flavobacteriales bacterium]MDC3336617.1 DUF4271 domain-containing protein [Flavobacteriales bacterium]
MLYSEPIPSMKGEFSGNLTVFTCLLFCVLLLVVIKVRQTAKFRFIIASFYRGKSVIQPFKDGQIFASASALFLLGNFIVMSAILLHYAINILDYPGVNFCKGLYAYEIVLFIIGFYGLKLLCTRLIQFIIGMNEGLMEYQHNILLFCQNVGLVLLPLVVLITYIDINYKTDLIYVAISLFILLYFYRILKTVGISIRQSVPWLYLFLYLCAFEISPIIIAIKLLTGADS